MPGGRQVVLPADYVRHHVELGYATTAHRAQGRTVDTAHAFVSVTTQREVLYVAATRGRESNRLYVDTMYDPDADTQHGLPAEQDAGDVLRQVLEARGADQSATETIAADWAEQQGIVRMWVEYDTIAGVAQRDRYDELVTSACSGVPAEQVEGLRDSPAYGPLLAALREAEALGLDVEQGQSRLVEGRSVGSADDVAGVLHGRVDHWIRTAGPQRRAAADRIVGLFPRLAGVTDPDIGADRRHACSPGLSAAEDRPDRAHNGPLRAHKGRFPERIRGPCPTPKRATISAVLGHLFHEATNPLRGHLW